MTKERESVQHLRNFGANPPSDTFKIEQGEIALALDEKFPKIFFKKNDGEWAVFVDLQSLLNAELAIQKALSSLNNRIANLEDIIGEGIVESSISDYLANRDPDHAHKNVKLQY
jgi:hypothetical protein